MRTGRSIVRSLSRGSDRVRARAERGHWREHREESDHVWSWVTGLQGLTLNTAESNAQHLQLHLPFGKVVAGPPQRLLVAGMDIHLYGACNCGNHRS
eukprot:3218733-Pyramimonas_sp.AAC.1